MVRAINKLHTYRGEAALFTLDLGPFNESAEAHDARRLRWQVTVTIEAATGGPDKLSGNGQTDLVAGRRVGSPFADPTDTD